VGKASYKDKKEERNMSKEKNKNTFRVAALLLVACLISSVMLSGTFAKYTSKYSGQDTALVARWSFTAKGSNTGGLGDMGSATELALFDHLYTKHINQIDGTTFIIAPGVEDEFMIKMDYLADVDADVEIAFEKLPGSAAVPVEYSVDGGANWVTLTDLPEALAVKIASAGGALTDPATGDATFRIAAVSNSSTTAVSITETIKWKWRYNKGEAGSAYGGQTDAKDTTLGEASQTAVANSNLRTKYGIKVTVKATQVTPTTDGPISFTGMGPISGTLHVGDTLTAGTITPTGATVTYQWQVGDATGYAPIAGETFPTYQIDVHDEGVAAGKYIRVVATGTGDPYTGTVTSAPVGPIEAAEED
jgi:hypothetical protein